MLYIAPGHTSLLYCISVSLSLFLHSVIALFLSSMEWRWWGALSGYKAGLCQGPIYNIWRGKPAIKILKNFVIYKLYPRLFVFFLMFCLQCWAQSTLLAFKYASFQRKARSLLFISQSKKAITCYFYSSSLLFYRKAKEQLHAILFLFLAFYIAKRKSIYMLFLFLFIAFYIAKRKSNYMLYYSSSSFFISQSGKAITSYFYSSS